MQDEKIDAGAVEKILTPIDAIEVSKDGKNSFSIIYQKMMNVRWHISFITLIILLFIIVGIIAAIVLKVGLDGPWKEILLLMLGMFGSSFNRIIDFWFNNSQRDSVMIEKIDSENDAINVAKMKIKQTKSDKSNEEKQAQTKEKSNPGGQ